MVTNVITSSFKRSGIYPFNPKAISCGIITASKQETASTIVHITGRQTLTYNFVATRNQSHLLVLSLILNFQLYSTLYTMIVALAIDQAAALY